MRIRATLVTIAWLVVGVCFGDSAERRCHVTVDLSDTARYERTNPGFAKAFEFLRRSDLKDLPPGRYQIDGSNCWAIVLDADLMPMKERQVEAHRTYIDIQVPLGGEEAYGLWEMDDEHLTLPFDEQNDIVLFKGDARPVTIKPGQAFIFFPPYGAHKPACQADKGPSRIRKVVVKIRADAALHPLTLKTPDAAHRDSANIHYQTGPSIAVAPNGRLWVAIMTGGRYECNDNYVDLLTSGDEGATWSEPKFALDIDGPLRTFDPAMWTDPSGRVWFFWCQVYDIWDGRGGLWASVCENPDEEKSLWSAPRRLCDGVMKNKPLVLRNGDIWLCVEQWRDDCQEWFWKHLNSQPQLPTWYHPDTSPIGANVYRSTDNGMTWSWFSTVPVPDALRTCDEHMVVEQGDGTFRMLLRVKTGLAESRSSDGGKTWSVATPGAIKNPPGRFFFGRLRSGNILFVKNGPIDVQTDRCDLMAFLSEDDGKTFPFRLELDMRTKVSYPDVAEGVDGRLYCVHDYDREGVGEIVLDMFTEDDIRAGRVISSKSCLHRIVRKNALLCNEIK